MYGYIYVRNHYSYDEHDLYKLGKTINIPDRDSNYITGEPIRGEFKLVLELPIKIIGIVEKLLQNEFQNLHCKFNGGSEFYKREIINKIMPYLDTLNLKYRVLTKEEVDSILRKYRAKKLLQKINKKDLIKLLSIEQIQVKQIEQIQVKQIEQIQVKQIEQIQVKQMLIPRDDQEKIINKSVLHFQNNNKGLLVIPCGVGKTLLSLWIVQNLNLKTVLIGVPNILLLKQWENKTKYIFGVIPHFIISKSINKNALLEFLKNNYKNCIIITTYKSSYKVLKIAKLQNFIFDIKINDECHHLTSANINYDENTKKYINMLNIPSIKQLSLTATLKNIIDSKNEIKEYKKNIISNDDIEHFGNIITRKSLLWAINKNIICDYVIQTILFDKVDLDKVGDDIVKLDIAKLDKVDLDNLYIAAYTTLKSIADGHSHHLLIYSNNKNNSETIIKYINELIKSDFSLHFNTQNIFVSSYHSNIKSSNQKKIIEKFEKFKFGIISCVYCLGEGWDFPKLDGVVFAEYMGSSIRIFQCALRASRKNINEPNKITKIILPICDFNIASDSFKKIKEVIYHMGLEDETISQKIKAFKIKNDKVNDKLNINVNNKACDVIYDEKLTNQIKLYTKKRSMLDMTYTKAKQLLAKKNIKSKDEYYNLCDNDNRFSKEPDVLFKDIFKNWIDYFSIERNYYDLETCKKKINEYIAKYPELKKHYLKLSNITSKLSELDPLFPPCGLWEEYYNVKDIGNLITLTNNKKEIRKINRIK